MPVLKMAGSVSQVMVGGCCCAQTGVDAAAAKQKPARVLSASVRKDRRCEILESADFLKLLLQIFILPIADCRLPIADYTSG
ncbi:MAG: hypothetical protein LBP52_08905 [Burkholderiaceae bacterium]|jgi:hypothetical protein|nr:hypothetical protein [Burkholderiaceae bacterium]